MTAMRELEAAERQSGNAVQESLELRELSAAELARVEGGVSFPSMLSDLVKGGSAPVKP
jgi:hypothetical protein